MIKENIIDIRKRIDEAAQKSNRKSEDITFVCVTKTVEEERIKEAIGCGVTDIGENKVQEMLKKQEKIENVKWHLIGHLQTNKAKMIINNVSLFHALDSISLADELDKRAKQNSTNFNALIEVNIANEHTKFGVNSNHLFEFVNKMYCYENLTIQGIMAIPPFVDDGEKNRNYFKKMYELFLDIGFKKGDNVNMKFLSMGMTNDYTVAIEEGANIVRIGTGVFGTRM